MRQIHPECSRSEFGLSQRVLLITLMILGGLVTGQIYLVIPLVGQLAEQFAVTPKVGVLAGSAFGFAYALGLLMLGALSDRYGRKRVMLVGLIATTVTTTLAGFAWSFEGLLVARALQGLTAAAFPPAALALIPEILPVRLQPLALSAMGFAFLSSASLSQLLVVELGLSFQETLRCLAPIYLVGAAILFFSLRGQMPRNAPSLQKGIGGIRALVLLQNRTLLATWAAGFTVLFGLVSFHQATQALGEQLGTDIQMLRWVGLPPLLLTFVAASLMQRYGAAMTAGGGLLVAAGAFCMVLIEQGGWMVMASMLLSSGIALAVPSLIAVVSRQAAPAHRGLALAIYSFTLFLGASLGGPLSHVLARLGVATMLLTPALALALAAILLMHVVGVAGPNHR